MRQLFLGTGGRPFANDDLEVLQERTDLAGLASLLHGLGPCVVYGCAPYYNGQTWGVASGLLWDGGLLVEFDGQSGVTLPMMFRTEPLQTVDTRAYQTAGSQPAIQEYTSVLIPVAAGAPALKIDTDGAITIWDRIKAQTLEVGQVEYVTDLTGYDATGKGTGRKRGWALANGENGTHDLRARFILGHNPNKIAFTATSIANSGGEERHTLLLSEMPPHDHVNGAHNQLLRTSGGGAVTVSSPDSSPGEPDVVTSSAMQPAGGGGAHNNMPPYYVLAARQWVGLP